MIGLQLAPTAVTTNADLLVFLLIGLLAGAHCLGMCGPLVGLYADRMSTRESRHHERTVTPYVVRQHALFNGGRVIGYATIGTLLGLLGGTVFASIDTVSSVGTGVRALTGLLVGSFIVIAGAAYTVRGSSASMHGRIPFVSGVFQRVTGVLTGRVDRLATSPGIIALGTVHALLPCPILYPAYLYAFAIGDPVRGGLSLAVLGLGTFPSLFAYGTMLGSLNARQRGTLHRVLGVAFLALGYILLSHGLLLLGVNVPHLDIPYYQPLTQP